MRAPGDIVLLSCYESGHQPLALAWPLAFLRQAGFTPVAIDLAVEAGEGGAAAEALARAKLVAISVPMHTALRLGVRAAEKIRELNPGATICFFGLYAPLFRDELLKVGDRVLGAEPERELVKVGEEMSGARGMSPPTHEAAVGGMIRGSESGGRDPGSGVGVGRRRLPLIAPDRAGLPPLERYARLVVGDERRLAGYTEASRGCKHMCRHCPIPAVYAGRFTAVPVDLVLDDVRRQVAAGARHVTFGDADFLNGPRHAVAVAEAVHAEFPSLTWDATIKVEHLLAHRELLSRFAPLGCVFIVSAFESLSDRVLAILDKGHTAAGSFEALDLVRAAGISLRPTFVPFTPWTSRADYEELVRFIHDRDLHGEVDPVQLSLRLLVPPGSLLLDHPEMRPHLRGFDPDTATWRWVHPDPEMDRLAADVAARVERGLAERTAAETHSGAPAKAGGPPHLSEPWFC